MRVALSFPGCHRRGGVERIVFECARYLASRGHEVDVFASEWEPDESHPIRYRHVPTCGRPSFLRGPSYFRQCTRMLNGLRYDVLNTHGCVCPTGGVHWVQSLHRAWLDRSRAFRGALSVARMKQRLNPLHPILLRLEYRHFAQREYRKLIATTPQVRHDLRRYYGVPEEDVVIVPNGFAPGEFNPELRERRRGPARLRLRLRPEQVAMLFVANELERKGYATILAAMAKLRRPELRLLVVGRPDVADVMRRAERFGVAEQVIACGPARDVAEYHAAADLFVLPTQYEAFCLAILEALGSGLPVVTSNVPGARDAIVAGKNGLLINDPQSGEELAETIRPLLDSDLRDSLSAAAPASVEPFQWPAVLARYERELISSLN